MAVKLKVETRIAIVFDPVLGQVYNQIESQIGKIEKLAWKIGDALQVNIDKALPLATAFKNANDTAAESAKKWQTILEDIGKKLGDQLQKLPRLTRAYEGLGKAMGAARMPAGGQPSGRESSRDTVIDASRTVLDSAGGAVEQFAGYDGIVRKLARQGERDPAKWAERKQQIEVQIGEMMRSTSMSRTEAATQLYGMFDAGMGINGIATHANLAAKFTDGQQVDDRTTSVLFRTLLSNGVEDGQLENFLNNMIGQSGTNFGVGATAEAVSRLLPELGEGPEDAARLVAIIQQEAKKTSNPVDVMSAARTTFLKYKEAGGSQAADLTQYGQEYMPATATPPKRIDNMLEDRKQTQEWQLKERESANERLSIGVGGSLAPIYSAWTNFMIKATNGLAVVVENLGWVGTVLGGVVVGTAALMTAYAALAKARLLLGAGKAVMGPRGPNVWRAFRQKADEQGNKRRLPERARDAGKALLDPDGKRRSVLSDARKAFSDEKTGRLGRAWNAAKTLGTMLPEPLQGGRKGLGGALLTIVGGAVMAADMVDTAQGAETGQEKAEGYGEAAGTVIGTVLGGFLGPLGSFAGGYLGGIAGKHVGRMINEHWGDGSKKEDENPGQPGSTATGAGTGQPGAAVKEAAGGPSVSAAGAPTPLEHGDVVRNINNTTAAASLPEPGATTGSAVTHNTSQQIAVAPNISINVQGVVTDPMDFIRVITPEMNRIVEGLVAGANRGGQNYDVIDQNLGLV